VVGVANAFTHLDIDSQIDAVGKMRHIILPTSIPSWAGLNVDTAQRFLNNSGLEAFMAEYQNDFSQYRSGRVISNYNEEAQVITWSMFEKVFGERRIPKHWRSMCGLDVGYTGGQYPHFSAWSFIATSAMNSKYPNKMFMYRSRVFKETSIDEQAERIKKSLWENERVVKWQMSHEKTGEMMTLNQKHGFNFSKFKYYKAEDGVPQWQHLSMCDKTQPNPFKDDEQLPDGTWKIGCPTLFYIVDDDQLFHPKDDNGMMDARRQIAQWEYVPVKLNELGQTVQKPSKVDDDVCDSVKGIIALWGEEPEPFTIDELLQHRYERSTIFATELAHETGIGAQMSRQYAAGKARKLLAKEEGIELDEYGEEKEPDFLTDISNGW